MATRVSWPACATAASTEVYLALGIETRYGSWPPAMELTAS
jgi:hypothetical protein